MCFWSFNGDGYVIASVACNALYATILQFRAPSWWYSRGWFKIDPAPRDAILWCVKNSATSDSARSPYTVTAALKLFTFSFRGNACSRNGYMMATVFLELESRLNSLLSSLSHPSTRLEFVPVLYKSPKDDSLLSSFFHSWRLESHTSLRFFTRLSSSRCRSFSYRLFGFDCCNSILSELVHLDKPANHSSLVLDRRLIFFVQPWVGLVACFVSISFCHRLYFVHLHRPCHHIRYVTHCGGHLFSSRFEWWSTYVS